MNDIVYIIENTLDKEIDNSSIINMYYQMGLKIKEYKLDIKDVDYHLKQKYGIVIAFTERNLNNMIKFSNYDASLLPKLQKITWKNILVILKNNDELIDTCLSYNPTKQQLIDYIKKNKKLIFNKDIEIDDTLEELKKLKKERGVL